MSAEHEAAAPDNGASKAGARVRMTDHSTDAAVHAMTGLPGPSSTGDSGLPVGFRSHRTLPIRVELARQLKRRRTQLSLGFMVLLPLILVIAFSVGDSDEGARSSFVDLAQQGAGNFALVTLFFSATFLLVVVVSLFFGDTVASEASWSSLRYLLAMPVPRLRLLRQKMVVAGILSLTALVLLVASGWIIGAIAYGTDPLTTPIGDRFTTGESLGRLAIVVVSVALQLAWVAGLAFLLSVTTDAPLGAVGGAVLLTILSQILDQIDALEDLRNFLPTHYSFAWTGAMVDPVRWDDMVRGGFSSVAYATVFFTLAFLRFRRKDITS